MTPHFYKRQTPVNFMLAKPIGSLSKLPKGAWIPQPKLNGIRAKWDAENKVLMTRNGNVIKSVDHIVTELATLPAIGYDGELYLADIPFQELNGRIRRQKQQFPECKFIVFDAEMAAPFVERLAMLDRTFAGNKHLKHVVQIQTGGLGDIEQQYHNFLAQGYEGIILREAYSHYIDGRKGQCLKFKPVFDIEADLIGLEATESKHAATFGAMVLRIPGTQKTFTCSGLSDLDRAQIHKSWMRDWQNRSKPVQATIEFGAMSSDGIPIFPRFKSIRYDL